MVKRLLPSPPNYYILATVNIHRSILVIRRDAAALRCAPEEWCKIRRIGMVSKGPGKVRTGKSRQGP
jgi:hypothetical protein